MALLKCNQFFGGITLLDSDPARLVLHDAIYVPTGDALSADGIFDHGQKAVLQARYFHGQDPLRRETYLGTPYRLENLKQTASGSLYIYCGHVHEHFGHFLLSTLSRFWSVLSEDPGARILYHGKFDISYWFAQDWAATIFTSLGLLPERFERFHQPTRIPNLVVPAPAFEEENFAHRRYATFMNALGVRLATGHVLPRPDPSPAYLSKQRLRRGVQRLVNEPEIAEHLDRHGVRIVCIEEMGFAEQAAFWYNNDLVASFANSSLHAGILAPGRNVVTISYGQALMSNYPLVDRVNGANARYFRLDETRIENTGPDGNFTANHVVRDPAAVAGTLLTLFDMEQRSAAGRCGVPVWPRSRFWRPEGADVSEEGLVSLAVDRPSQQSSVHLWTDPDRGAATGGRLTGEFAFHTNLEAGAWWQTDLEHVRPVSRVRLFNRMDATRDRCSRFVVELRREDGSVAAAHHQDQPVLFGGLDGDPFTWILPEPVEAQLVRVILLGENYLHLDQVEVLGPSAGPVVDRQQPRFGAGPPEAVDPTGMLAST